jgi:hypothetical protein
MQVSSIKEHFNSRIMKKYFHTNIKFYISLLFHTSISFYYILSMYFVLFEFQTCFNKILVLWGRVSTVQRLRIQNSTYDQIFYVQRLYEKDIKYQT